MSDFNWTEFVNGIDDGIRELSNLDLQTDLEEWIEDLESGHQAYHPAILSEAIIRGLNGEWD